jgi:HAD superfamily hydrolase (TIGR01509 family)
MAAPLDLVIFDCDGVLVDSEPLADRVLLEGLAARGMPIEPSFVEERFLGRSLAAICAILRDECGIDLSHDDLEEMRLQLYALFRRELRPIRGIEEALDGLALTRCVASSSQLERIRLSLEVTGLLSRLEPYLFSATMVARGKPAPDLFLHAAGRMGAEPGRCLVIEDSAAGVTAAKAAGMRVFAFIGGGHAQGSAHRARLEALAPDVIFGEMAALPALVGELS